MTGVVETVGEWFLPDSNLLKLSNTHTHTYTDTRAHTDTQSHALS